MGLLHGGLIGEVVQVRLPGNARLQCTFDCVPGEVVRARPPPGVEEGVRVEYPIIGELLQSFLFNAVPPSAGIPVPILPGLVAGGPSPHRPNTTARSSQPRAGDAAGSNGKTRWVADREQGVSGGSRNSRCSGSARPGSRVIDDR